jgi:hypothetical protein
LANLRNIQSYRKAHLSRFLAPFIAAFLKNTLLLVVVCAIGTNAFASEKNKSQISLQDKLVNVEISDNSDTYDAGFTAITSIGGSTASPKTSIIPHLLSIFPFGVWSSKNSRAPPSIDKDPFAS